MLLSNRSKLCYRSTILTFGWGKCELKFSLLVVIVGNIYLTSGFFLVKVILDSKLFPVSAYPTAYNEN